MFMLKVHKESDIIKHWLRMHHGYFPNSVGPISYLGYKYIHVFGFGQKGKVFFVEKTTVVNWMIEIMDKGLTVPKWVLIIWPKIPPKNQSLYVMPICPISPKVWDIVEKGFFGRP